MKASQKPMIIALMWLTILLEYVHEHEFVQGTIKRLCTVCFTYIGIIVTGIELMMISEATVSQPCHLKHTIQVLVGASSWRPLETGQ